MQSVSEAIWRACLEEYSLSSDEQQKADDALEEAIKQHIPDKEAADAVKRAAYHAAGCTGLDGFREGMRLMYALCREMEGNPS